MRDYLNCKSYLYDFEEKTLEQLLNKFFDKINKCIDEVNLAKEFWEFVKTQGLKDEVIKQIEELYNNGKLTELINKLASDVNLKLETLKEEVNTQLEQKANEVDLVIERDRINNLAKLEQGSTTGDAELMDGRVGINGQSYINIGDAIRTQIGKIAEFSVNLYEFGGYGLYEENGINNTSQSYWYCKPIKCGVGDEIKINKRVSWASSWIAILDKNGALISGVKGALSSWINKTNTSYDTITIKEYNYNGYVLNKDNIGYIVVSFSSYDNITDTTKNVVVKNVSYPSSFTKNSVTLKPNIPLSETQEVQVQNKIDDSILKSKNIFNKGVVLLNFDAFNFTDKRFEILQEYGFKATVTLGTQLEGYVKEKADKYKKIMNNGWDIALYSSVDWVKDKYGNEAFSSTSAEVVKAWDDYVAFAIKEAELNGVYYPQTWFCRQNAYCDVLGNALKKHGIKMCRGEDFISYSKTPMYFIDNFSFVNRTKGLYPSTVNGVLWEIDQAVNDKKGVSIFSHGIYSTDSEAETNFGCTEANLRTILDKIKTYVEQGKLEVLTYSELYNRYNINDSTQIRYNRLLKMTTM